MGLNSSKATKVTQYISYFLLDIWFQGTTSSGCKHKTNNNWLFEPFINKVTWQDQDSEPNSFHQHGASTDNGEGA